MSNTTDTVTNNIITEEKIKGKVKWYDPKKGIGYIQGDDGKDYYIHHSGLTKAHVRNVLLDGEEVTMHLKEGKKGIEATDVCIIPRERTE